MSSRPAGRTCCAGRPHSSRAWAATLPRCCSRRPGGSSRSTSDWPGRPTCPRGWRRCSPGAWPAPADPPRPADLILDGLALLVTDGPAAAAPALRHVVSAFTGPGISAAQGLRWGWYAQAATSALWDDDAWRAMLVQQVRLARDAGALDQLPIMLGDDPGRRDRLRAGPRGALPGAAERR